MTPDAAHQPGATGPDDVRHGQGCGINRRPVKRSSRLTTSDRSPTRMAVAPVTETGAPLPERMSSGDREPWSAARRRFAACPLFLAGGAAESGGPGRIAPCPAADGRDESREGLVPTPTRRRTELSALADGAPRGVELKPCHGVEIQPGRGCHRPVIRLYPPLARKRDRDRKPGTARPLLFSADFVSFRAPIDSVMDLGGRPRRPSDPFLSLAVAVGRCEKSGTKRLTLRRCFNRSATLRRNEGFVKNSKVR